MLQLTYFGQSQIPVEAECLAPDQLAGKTPGEIARLPVQHGNSTAPLGDFFEIAGHADDQELRLMGDCSRVKGVGRRMQSGRIVIAGDIGMHVGAEMQGGEIVVQGQAADWAGAEMRGGTLRIHGNAGDLLGGCYRGGRTGMRGGEIFVDGHAGHETGHSLRRGFIAVGGQAGDFTGVSMIAGTIFVFGSTGRRIGAGMKRGTIATFGTAPALLPTFRYASQLAPAFLAMYFRRLDELGFLQPQANLPPVCRRYCGDLASLGKGEILVFDAAAT
ncbi:MAG: formylmethanofuran dehydrogenase subunit C [Planctomycetes bacterium]|nr:formylmethanofuran dehydrogenase subunit C [Planctomycetota bacterium]